MDIFIRLLAITSSPWLTVSLVLFFIILTIGFGFTVFQEKIKKNKLTRRIEHHREFNEDDVFEEFKEKNKYSDAFNRYIRPYISKNQTIFDKLLKAFGLSLETIQKQLLRANVKNIKPEEIAVLKMIGMFGSILILVATVPFMGMLGFGIGGAFYLFLAIVPSRILTQKYNDRKEKINEVLPVFLRLMSNATETGHTIEDAIIRVSNKYDCILAEEFKKVEAEAKFSNDWLHALENMAYRNDVDELYNLVSEIKITKEKGIAITDTLVRHAEKMETEKVLNSSEKARKQATTLMLPIFLFLFAPLLGIIVLPAMNIINNAF